MAITNPQAVRFSNERIRPICEKLRALKAEILDAQTAWFSGINLMFPNDSTVLDDGRAGREGVSVLTGANVNNVMSVVGTVASDINDQIVGLPCVNPLRAS